MAVDSEGDRPKRKFTAKRKAIDLSPDQAVTTGPVHPDNHGPLMMRARLRLDLAEWASSQRPMIEEALLRHGAILFRGFQVRSSNDFRACAVAMSDQLIEYKERSSPRSEVGERVYTSTDYPATHSIFPHNEHSYSLRFPSRLFFYCEVKPVSGGQTPLTDCRKVYHRISPATREKLIAKGWMYVRNFGDGFGLSLETVFQTSDRAEVERYCREQDIAFEWKDRGRLRTRQVRRVIARHPRTAELVWFNHATFFHISTLEPEIREGLINEFKEEDLPNNTFYGDGSPFEPEVIEELREAYLSQTVSFDWELGDVVMIDNLLTAHARAPYSGPRRILFAMADPLEQTAVQP